MQSLLLYRTHTHTLLLYCAHTHTHTHLQHPGLVLFTLHGKRNAARLTLIKRIQTHTQKNPSRSLWLLYTRIREVELNCTENISLSCSSPAQRRPETLFKTNDHVTALQEQVAETATSQQCERASQPRDSVLMDPPPRAARRLKALV